MTTQLQPYRQSEITQVKLHTPINLGPAKRLGQAALIISPEIIGITTSILFGGKNTILAFVAFDSVYRFISFFFSCIFIEEIFNYKSSTVKRLLLGSMWPVLTIYGIFYGIFFGIRNFSRWIIRGSIE